MSKIAEAFNNKKIPAVGMAFGMERIIVALKELGLDKRIDTDGPKFLLYVTEKANKEVIDLTNKLREKYCVSLVTSEDLTLEEAIEYCKTLDVSMIAIYDREKGLAVEKIEENVNIIDKPKHYTKKFPI